MPGVSGLTRPARNGLNRRWPITIRYLRRPPRACPARPLTRGRRCMRAPARRCSASCGRSIRRSPKRISPTRARRSTPRSPGSRLNCFRRLPRRPRRTNLRRPWPTLRRSQSRRNPRQRPNLRPSSSQPLHRRAWSHPPPSRRDRLTSRPRPNRRRRPRRSSNLLHQHARRKRRSTNRWFRQRKARLRPNRRTLWTIAPIFASGPASGRWRQSRLRRSARCAASGFSAVSLPCSSRPSPRPR